MRTIGEIQSLIRERSTLPTERREAVIVKRFAALPKRLTSAASRWPLETSRVLDVGCSYGHCLVHFGPGSVGLDNVSEHVEFCRSLGLDARLTDVEQDLAAVEDSAFDIVWVSDVLERLDAPRLLVRRLSEKLRPGGRLIAFVNVLPRSRLARAALRGRGWFDADAHHHQFTVETAQYLLERSGYRVGQVVVHPLPSRLDSASRALRPLTPVVFISAQPEASRHTQALAAERRNKPEAIEVTIRPVHGRQRTELPQ